MKKEYIILVIFAAVLFLFALFSTHIIFHDVPEYITIAKNFAGINNIDLFSTHSLLYPLIMSPFLKISNSLVMIKLVNCLWLFLIAVVLSLWLKNKKAMILFIFSPLVWHISIQTTPVLPASFFFLIAFIFFKKENLKGHMAYSGIFLGLSCTIYDPLILVSAFFILVYFWKKNISSLFWYLIFMAIGFLPRLIMDFYLFHMPFYSLIRYFGTNAIIALGLNSRISMYEIFRQPAGLLIIVAISPLLYTLYRLDWRRYKQEAIFLGIIFFVFIIRAALIKYFMIIAPIIIILLSLVMTEKEIKWHCILSIILIVLMTFSYFTPNPQSSINQDMKEILHDYSNVSYILVYPGNDANTMAVFSWQDNPRFVWFQDYEASLTNQTRIKGYDFSFNSKIPLKDRLVISASFNRFENKTYSNYIAISQNKDEIPGFAIEKCYKVLCVYKNS